jgi:hypothetical protein
MMTGEDVKFALSVGMPSLMVLVGILINNSRLSDLRQSMDKRFDGVDKRFDDTNRLMDKRFDDTNRLIEARFQIQDEKLYRVEQVMDARLRHIEERG